LSTVSPQLFISYRREDTAGHAGRLYDAMVARFGERMALQLLSGQRKPATA
jgi:hypothetical protein